MPDSQHIRILGTKLSLLDTGGLLGAVREFVDTGRKATIASANVLSLNTAWENPWFRKFLNESDVVRLDGFGVRLGAGLLGYRTPARSTWADFGWDLASFAEQHGCRLFLFGGKSGVAAAAGVRLTERYPDLRIVGSHHGYIDLERGTEENDSLVRQVNASGADILIVGLGMPRQERWVVENRADINASVVMTGGGVFDFLSGKTRRAPRWMLDHGLEWLFRLFLEPRRMWRRYLVGNPLFLLRVLTAGRGNRRVPGDSGAGIS